MKTTLGKIIAGIVLLAGGAGAGVVAPTLGASENTPFTVVSGAQGYVSKTDPTNLPANFLVAGSQNVVINDNEKVETRAGYELYGLASTTNENIDADFVWDTSSGTEYLFRKASSTLYVSIATSTDQVFEPLIENLAATTTARFTTAWNASENKDVLLFVNGNASLYEWSGGRGTYTSSAATTITLNENVGRSRFWAAGTRQIRVLTTSGWITFTYTGASGNQFTGITPDPTTYTIATDAPVLQAVRTNALTLQSGNLSLNYDLISSLANQVYLASETNRQVYVSKDTSYTDFSFSSPRATGEGADFVFDDAVVGFAPADEETMLVFAGKSKIYRISYEIIGTGASNTETTKITPLLSADGQGAISQELIAKIKNAVVWVNNNQELVELGQVENLPSVQAVAISDPIRPDFAGANFSNGKIEFWQNDIFITAPNDGKFFVFNLSKRFWQPPQIIDVGRISVFNNTLYGHSFNTPQTYQLFTGTNDNGNPISFKAHFAYQNGGRRDVLKSFDEFLTEMYVSNNTKITVSLLYEWKGSESIVSYEIDGSDQSFLFTPSADASLGVNSLGTNPLGSVLLAGENTPKYRRFKPVVPNDFFEFQPRFESEETDAQFQIVAHGTNIRTSGNRPSYIIK